MARREPAAKMLTMALAWIGIFAAGFVLFTFRDNFGWVAQRLKAEAVGTPVQQGSETRIPMAIDGHFWVNAKVNGKDVKFLVDSGATMTTIDIETAVAAGVPVFARARSVCPNRKRHHPRIERPRRGFSRSEPSSGATLEFRSRTTTISTFSE